MKQFTWNGQHFCLHPHRLMFWEEEKILIGSDLHLGKIGHFRKAGIALPQQAYKEDLHRLFAALQYFQPKKFLIVGDLFHSKANKELDWFLRWRSDLSSIGFLLIRGNHDLLSEQWYQQHDIAVCPSYTCGGLHFVHDPQEATGNRQQATGNEQMVMGSKQQATDNRQPARSSEQDLISCIEDYQLKEIAGTVSGHLHPGIRLSGFARQSVQLPCFHFSPTQCILPAFGQFTGLYTIRPQQGDSTFVLLNNEIIQL